MPVTTSGTDEAANGEFRPIREELQPYVSSSATNVALGAEGFCADSSLGLRPSERPGTADSGFVDTYLAPIISPRNEVYRINFKVATFRRRLERRREIIDSGRRHVP